MSIAIIAQAVDALGVNKRIKDIKTKTDDLETLVNESVSDLSQQIVSVANDASDAVNNSISQFATQIGAVYTAIGAQYNDLTSAISQASAAASQEVANAITQLNQAIDDSVTTVNNTISALETTIAAQIDQASSDSSAEIAAAISTLETTLTADFNDAISASETTINGTITAHTSNTSNPHSVTASQVGLGSVQNYGIASQAEAEAGTVSNKYMTPERTKQAITAQTGSTIIDATHGGTGITSWTTGDIPYASATNTVSKLASVATGNVLRSGGIGVAPSWGKVNLTTDISGNLPVSNLNSGTGASGTTFWCGDGTWKTISSSATLTATRIGFGDGSNLLSGSASLTYDSSNNIVQLGVGTGISTIRTANASSGANAASLTIQTGNANAGAVGAGTLKLQGGAGAGTSNSGDLELNGGDTTGSGTGGSVTINAGNSTGGAKGSIPLKIAGTTVATVTTSGLEVTALIPTGTTAPSDGIYKKSAGVVGMAANNTAAFMWGSNAIVSQTGNARDVGELGLPFRDIFSANAVTVTSDERTKTDIADSDLGLNLIDLLRPVSYRKIVGQVEVSNDGLNIETPIPGVRTHYGLLSQQVKQVLDQLGKSNFAVWCLADPSNPDSAQALRYEQFISPIIKSIQELHAMAIATDDTIESFDNRLESLEQLVASLNNNS